MDMNKAFFLRKEDRNPNWHVVDATDQILGRLSTQVADLLRGKTKAEYTPHTDTGDYVIITNCEKIKLTGNKWSDKIYATYSGWRGGKKEVSAEKLFEKDPRRLISYAVRGMLPKNKINRQVLKKLKVYVGGEHPHQAQVLKSNK